MKKKIFILVVTSIFVAGTVFTSCQSSTQNRETSQVKDRDARGDINSANQDARGDMNSANQDARGDMNSANQDANKADQKVATAEEWKTFRSESDLKINENEIRINELKLKMNRPGEILDPLYTQKITTLEQQNKDLRGKLSAYETSQGNWESFKREFKTDMDAIGESFKNLTVDNR